MGEENWRETGFDDADWWVKKRTGLCFVVLHGVRETNIEINIDMTND